MKKVCTICKEEKLISDFNRNKRNKDGYATECRECMKEYLRVYRKKNQEVLLEKSRQFKETHRERINQINRNRYHEEKKFDTDFMKKKREANQKYKRKNKGKINADTAKRYTIRLQRSCLCTENDYKKIDDIYKKASYLTETTGIIHHVDHIIPLQGKLVSGLHIPSNLQILTANKNCTKHNKFIV